LRRIAPLALALLAGCPLVSLEAEIPDACLTYKNVEIPAVPPGIAFTHTKELAEFPLTDGFLSVDAVVTRARAKLIATSGVSNFQFVDGLVVTIDSGEMQPFDLIACEDGSCASSSKETIIAANTPVNLIDYMSSGPAAVTVQLTGDLPQVPWTADIEICLSGTARLSVEP
jgi:hypothetical protein